MSDVTTDIGSRLPRARAFRLAGNGEWKTTGHCSSRVSCRWSSSPRSAVCCSRPAAFTRGRLRVLLVHRRGCRCIRCAEHVVRCRYRQPDEPHRKAPIPRGAIEPGEALYFGLALSIGSVVLLGLAGQLDGGCVPGLHHLLLCRHLHDVAEALDAAEHRDRRLAGAFPPMIAWTAVTGSHRSCQRIAVPCHLHVDAAAFLGAGAVQDGRL
jgi:hypothetical protein